jgi:integrase
MIDQEMLTLQRQILLDKLMEIDKQTANASLRKRKGYTLMNRGGIWFVRYYDPKVKKDIPMNRSLNTTDRKEADILAVKYKESFIADYYRKKNKIKDIFELFSNYYKPEKSTYLQEQLKRGDRKLSQDIIKKYDSYMNNHWIPFLKENKITRIEEITLDGTIKSFQDYLLNKGISKKTINTNIINGVIKPVFNTVMKDKNIFDTKQKYNLKGAKQEQTGATPQAKTLFLLNNPELWKLYRNNKVMNESTYKKYRLWCLLSATTGLREAEIFHLRISDFEMIQGVPFVFVRDDDGRNLKTENAKRKVPVPSITLKAIKEYNDENNVKDYLFCNNPNSGIDTKGFMFAFQQLSAHLGYSRQDMIDKNLRFHSLRVFFKTLSNTSELKEDVVEYFMGHKIDMGSMKERYNNRNDLDDAFFAKYGKILIDYFSRSLKHDFTYTMKEVEFKDKRGKIQTYTTPVLDDDLYDVNNNSAFGAWDIWDDHELIDFIKPKKG